MYLDAMLLQPKTKPSELGGMNMDTIKIDKRNTLMVAHRGLSSVEPENTISAFVAAGNRSYFGIECDVHVTKDGKFVVIHDAETGRVAKENINVEESTFEDVRKVLLDNYSRAEKAMFPDEHRQNRGDLIIPSISEYISICKKYDKKCVIELKGVWTIECIDKMVEEIKGLEYLENVIFISFNLSNLVSLRKRLPKQKAQYLVSTFNDEVLEVLNKYDFDLDIAHSAVTKELVELVHKNNHIVNCWTVNKAEDAEIYAEYGVDQITTENLE